MSRNKDKQNAFDLIGTTNRYMRRLAEISIAEFKWNFPPEFNINTRFLELTEFNDGNILFFVDDVLGPMVLPFVSGAKLDPYGDPLERTAYSVNGYQRKFDDSNSVIIWNNFLHTSSILEVKKLAEQLAKIDIISNINLQAQKTPFFIVCEDTERLTFENLYKKYDGNYPVIFGKSGINPGAVQVLSTNAPFLVDKFRAEKTEVWNEALTYIGVENSTDKKERLITAEAKQLQGNTNACRMSRMACREEAAEKISRMCGARVTCEYRGDSIVSDMPDEKGGR